MQELIINKELKIGVQSFKNAVILAPMEGITDLPFRIICKRLGADLVYSEFIAAEALIRDAKKSFDKLKNCEEEKPLTVQIFGSKLESMVEAARIVEQNGADILDINYGCWVKKVVNNNAGAAFLKNPEYMAEVTHSIVNAVKIPVTAKTRLGWTSNDINIFKVTELMSKTGIAALAVHCRTRDMGMRGSADWSWIPKIKEMTDLQIILNGDVRTPIEAFNAFANFNCDAVMIGRAAVGNPFLFRQVKSFLNNTELSQEATITERIDTCLKHLDLNIEYKGFPRGLYEFRKHYSGYLKNLYNASKVRQKIVLLESVDEIRRELDLFQKELLSDLSC